MVNEIDGSPNGPSRRERGPTGRVAATPRPRAGRSAGRVAATPWARADFLRVFTRPARRWSDAPPVFRSSESKRARPNARAASRGPRRRRDASRSMITYAAADGSARGDSGLPLSVRAPQNWSRGASARRNKGYGEVRAAKTETPALRQYIFFFYNCSEPTQARAARPNRRLSPPGGVLIRRTLRLS